MNPDSQKIEDQLALIPGYQKSQSEYKEAGFVDYLRILFKRKKLIFVFLILGVIAAGLANSFIKKNYTISAILEVGRISGQLIEGPGQIIGRLESDFYGITLRAKGEEYSIAAVKAINPKATDLIIISTVSGESEKAKQTLDVISNLILQEHQVAVEKEKTEIGNAIKTKEFEIQIAEDQFKNLAVKIKHGKNNTQRIENKIRHTEEEKRSLEQEVLALEKIVIYQQDVGAQFALFSVKEKLAQKKQETEDLYLRVNSYREEEGRLDIEFIIFEEKINNWKIELEKLKESLNDDVIKPTRIIHSPSADQKNLSLALILTIGGVLGIFAGGCLAFSKEWWDKNKAKLLANGI